MPRTCTVCSHAERPAIDAATVTGIETIRTIADQFGVSHQSLLRHRQHIPAALSVAKGAQEVTRAGDLLATLADGEARVLRALDRAEASKNDGQVFRGVRELRDCVRLLAELRGQLQTQGTVSVNMGAELADELSIETLGLPALGELEAEALEVLRQCAARRLVLEPAITVEGMAEGAAP
jgi:transposase-like protein